jgi:hypothetical protein
MQDEIGTFGNRVFAAFPILLVEREAGCPLVAHAADHIADEGMRGSFAVVAYERTSI